jgi:hypothetical protein
VRQTIAAMMSALGQKQTCAMQNVVSTLPPIATAKADFRARSCLLYSQERTCAAQLMMSCFGPKADIGPTSDKRSNARQDNPDFGELAGLRINLD